MCQPRVAEFLQVRNMRNKSGEHFREFNITYIELLTGVFDDLIDPWIVYMRYLGEKMMLHLEI